jgi:hypothetical protein
LGFRVRVRTAPPDSSAASLAFPEVQERFAASSKEEQVEELAEGGERRLIWLGFEVWGLEFGVWGLGFGVWGLGFGVWGFGVWGLGFGFCLFWVL